MPNPSPRVAWWCKDHRDLKTASVRIRGELVMRQLASRGHTIDWFDPQTPADCLVISKRLSDDTLLAAAAAKKRGCRLVIDFCDNIFIPKQDKPRYHQQIANLRQMVDLADALVAATPPLAEIIEKQCPNAPRPQVIGDLSDDLSVIPVSPWQRLLYRYKLRHELQRLRRSRESGRAQLIWFGTNGSKRGVAGYAALQSLLPMLDALNRTVPLRLTVISNRRRAFLEMVKGVGFDSRYIEWDGQTFETLLKAHDLTLIPAPLNDFSICKTDNRVVTSLRAGVAVAADSVPSYARYADVMSLGDIESGLRRYLGDPQLRRTHAAMGRQLVESFSDPEPIIRGWESVLQLTRPEQR